MDFKIRNLKTTDFPSVEKLCRRVYPDSPPWGAEQLKSHLDIFADGQFVAEDLASGEIIGMSSSLIIFWDDYNLEDSWRDFTDAGYFTNHDPERGKTLYGAEIMVDPKTQGHGVGSAIYKEREKLATKLGLLRIRAGARLRGYHQHAKDLSAQAYVEKVVSGEIFDPTLSFQLRKGFRVLATVSGYLRYDPESLGHAAVIEWLTDRLQLERERAPKWSRHMRQVLRSTPEESRSGTNGY